MHGFKLTLYNLFYISSVIQKHTATGAESLVVNPKQRWDTIQRYVKMLQINLFVNMSLNREDTVNLVMF